MIQTVIKKMFQKERTKTMRLNDAWTSPIESGIFTELKRYGMPWDSVVDSESLNMSYYYNHSGQKEVSPLISQLTETTLSDAQKTTVGKLVSGICKANWEYLYKAFFSDYDPIENYNATEESTDSRSHITDHTGSDETAHTGTDTTAHTGTDGTTHKGTDTTANTGTDTTTDEGTIETVNSIKDGSEKTINGIAGFNNDDDFSKDTASTKTVNQTVKNDETRKLSGSTKYGKTETNTIDTTDSTTYNTTDSRTLDTTDNTTYNNTIKESDSENHSMHRHGNIGVTTSQQMIESEIVLRQKNYFDIVFSDIDRLLTLSIY